MSRLALKLLGGFEVARSLGPAIAVPTKKAQALLAYLALTPGQTHPRDKLASLLWPDSPPGPARNALRQTFFRLRKALGPAGGATFALTGDAITLPRDAVQTDVSAFEEAVAEGSRSALEGAAALYRGDLLAGLSAEAPSFEEWLMSERTRLHELAVESLARLLSHQRAAGAIEPAVQSALRLLALDPLQEAAHRTLMRLHVQLGRRDAALRQYQECVQILRRELAVEPEAETKDLYRQILRQRPARAGPAPVAIGSSETPLVGRRPEMTALREALATALAGRGHVVAVIGEGGIGKSRLLAELAAEAGRRGAGVLIGRAYESERLLPFGPWIGALRDTGLLSDPRAFEGLGSVWLGELARLLPELGEPDRPAAGDPGDPRRLFEALAELLRHLALTQPIVVLLEDCHWADDATLRFLAFFARRLHPTPILVALSAREEEVSESPALQRTLDELTDERRLTRLTLGRLDHDDTLALARLGRAGAGADVDAQRAEYVWQASQGNPFIVVETMRAISDGVAVPAGALPIPSRVRDMIVRRLDRLSESARQLLRVAAVIGREFEFTLLQRAARVDEREAAEAVEELVRRRVVHGVGNRFDFTHERIRDVVAAGLLPPGRQWLHGAVAAALEELASEDVTSHYAVLGTHYREAGSWEKAVRCFRDAGRQATEQGAYREAVILLEQALSALAHLPDGTTTLEVAVDLRLDLRNALLPLGEFTAATTRLREAAAVAARLGDGARQVRAAAFLVDQLRIAGQPGPALDEGERALALAEPLQDPGPLILITVRLAQVHHLRGDYRRSVTLLKRSLEHARGPAGERFGLLQPPAVHSRYSLILSLAELGAFAEGRAAADEGLAIATALDQPVALGFAWAAFGVLALQRREWSAAIEAFERALELSRRGEVVSPWVPRFAGALGYARALSGHPVEGVRALGTALDQAASIEMAAARPLLLAWLAEARATAGDVRGALDTAAEALALAGRQGERGHAAWALRARAEAEARGSNDLPARAVRSYGEALALAAELEMLPLAAHCRLGLAAVHSTQGEGERAAMEREGARRLFAEMGMA